jgi:hypothetical protein
MGRTRRHLIPALFYAGLAACAVVALPVPALPQARYVPPDVTKGSYADPAWITSLAPSKVLPAQAGHAGEFLTTDGTSPSWAAASGGGGATLGANTFTATQAVGFSNSDYTNAAGANSHLVLDNGDTSSGQTSLTFTGGGATNWAKIRSDFGKDLSYVTYGSGAHFFYVGGEFGTGSVAMQFSPTFAMIQPTAAGNVGLIIRGQPSQTANVLEVQDSTTAVKASVSASGVFTGNGSGLTSIAESQVTNLTTDLAARASLGSANTFTVGPQTIQAGGAANAGLVFQGQGITATVNNVALASNVATLTTSAAHGFSAGQTVIISGLTNSFFNGTYAITGVTSTTFTYSLTHANVSSAADSGSATAISQTAGLVQVKDPAGTSRDAIGPLGNGIFRGNSSTAPLDLRSFAFDGTRIGNVITYTRASGDGCVIFGDYGTSYTFNPFGDINIVSAPTIQGSQFQDRSSSSNPLSFKIFGSSATTVGINMFTDTASAPSSAPAANYIKATGVTSAGAAVVGVKYGSRMSDVTATWKGGFNVLVSDSVASDRQGFRVDATGSGVASAFSGTPVAGQTLTAYAASAGNVALASQAASSQTADLAQNQNSSGTPVSGVDRNCYQYMAHGTGAPSPTSPAIGAFYLDNTSGSTKLYVFTIDGWKSCTLNLVPLMLLGLRRRLAAAPRADEQALVDLDEAGVEVAEDAHGTASVAGRREHGRPRRPELGLRDVAVVEEEVSARPHLGRRRGGDAIPAEAVDHDQVEGVVGDAIERGIGVARAQAVVDAHQAPRRQHRPHPVVPLRLGLDRDEVAGAGREEQRRHPRSRLQDVPVGPDQPAEVSHRPEAQPGPRHAMAERPQQERGPGGRDDVGQAPGVDEVSGVGVQATPAHPVARDESVPCPFRRHARSPHEPMFAAF